MLNEQHLEQLIEKRDKAQKNVDSLIKRQYDIQQLIKKNVRIYNECRKLILASG